MVIILCDRCHRAEDIRLGKWGQGYGPQTLRTGARARRGNVARGTPQKRLPRKRAAFGDLLPLGADPQLPPLVHLVGAPGTGKSTIARELRSVDERWRHVEVSRLFTPGRGEQQVAGDLTELLSTDRPVIIEQWGVVAPIARTIQAHVTTTGRSARAVLCYCEDSELGDRLRARGGELGVPELAARRATGVRYVVERLYPQTHAEHLCTAAPASRSAELLRDMAVGWCRRVAERVG